jgi:hypothetical protein
MNLNPKIVERFFKGKYSHADFLAVRSLFTEPGKKEELNKYLQNQWADFSKETLPEENIDHILDKVHHQIQLEARPVLFASCLVNPELPEITFKVDLREVSDMYEGGGAWVSFGNWVSWWVMNDADGDGIYSATGLLESGSDVKYFFGYQTGPNENSDYTGEKQELKGLDCASAGGFRLLSVPDSDLTISVVVYGICREAITPVFDLPDVKPASLFYNAINDQVLISNASEVEHVEVNSISGQQLIDMDANRQETIQINTNSLKKGVFIVRLRLANKRIQGVKFLK